MKPKGEIVRGKNLAKARGKAVCKTPRRDHTLLAKYSGLYFAWKLYRNRDPNRRFFFMSMVVARMQKMKADNLIGLGNHNQRRTENHSNKDIDVTRSNLNYDLVNRTNNYKTDIQQFINENKSSNRAVRKDAVLVNEWIVTSDSNFFKSLDPNETKRFFETAKEYFAENYGEENIRYSQVHMDERTPHMHLGIVPFTEDKRLSAKTIFNRQALQTIQDELPSYLKEKGFEIERGEEKSERKHLTVKEYKELKEKEKDLSSKVGYLEKNYEKYQVVMDTVKDIDVKSEPVMQKKGFLKREEMETDQVIIHKEDFKKLHDAYRFVPVLKKELATAKSAVRSQRDEKMAIREERNELRKEVKQQSKVLKTTEKVLNFVDTYLQEHLGVSLKELWKGKIRKSELEKQQSIKGQGPDIS